MAYGFFITKGWQCRVKALPFGDYEMREEGAQVPYFTIERKSLTDMYSSMMSPRLFQQAYTAVEAGQAMFYVVHPADYTYKAFNCLLEFRGWTDPLAKLVRLGHHIVFVPRLEQVFHFMANLMLTKTSPLRSPTMSRKQTITENILRLCGVRQENWEHFQTVTVADLAKMSTAEITAQGHFKPTSRLPTKVWRILNGRNTSQAEAENSDGMYPEDYEDD
jgi:hypothetical protein